ncbi:hypothetical protein [Halocalculus aciditolerans]|uniref:MoaD/ThiS family protein n=1 Tax=Halocalculus aciditolerans TaxID=1383812 RepID=A0A830F4E2_9EURY|nr:hypothetical protein [Halocalculus aciditolerans]GGL62408.1 hypothetical protein GCM10009039_20580 [Halocalculus aciditolerans]
MDVAVEVLGSLAARTGVHRIRVGVPEDATVEDVVHALADRCGGHAALGVLDGERLRADTVVVRAAGNNTLTASSRVVTGDTVRFRLAA